MSWKKESAKVGLSGLTPREAASESFDWPRFSEYARPPGPLRMSCKRRKCKYTIYTVFIFVYYVKQVDTMNSVLYCLNFQDGDAERESKTWFELGQEMGIVVVSSKEEEAEELTEED